MCPSADREGATAIADAVEPMPAPLADRLQAAVAGAWRERRDAIAATERADDAAMATPTPEAAQAAADDDQPLILIPTEPPAGAASTPRATPRRSRWRRAVPVLAFAVLATLAGTSVWLGGQDDQAGSARNDAATKSQQSTAGDAEAGGSAPADGEVPGANELSMGGDDTAADTTAAPAAAAPAAGDAAAKAGAEGRSSSSTNPDELDPALQVPPVGDAGDTGPGDVQGGLDVDGLTETQQAASDGRTCIATLDETNLALPDGRLATLIIPGPLGLYVVCG